MKRFIAIISLAVFALPLAAQVPSTQGGGTAERISTLEAPRATQIASNAATAQIDFRVGNFQYTNGIVTGTTDYEVKNLANALALNLTNLVPGVVRRVHIQTDGTARQINIVTNGITSGTRISYNLGVVTNGSYALSVTNRARVTLLARPAGEVQVDWQWYQ